MKHAILVFGLFFSVHLSAKDIELTAGSSIYIGEDKISCLGTTPTCMCQQKRVKRCRIIGTDGNCKTWTWYTLYDLLWINEANIVLDEFANRTACLRAKKRDYEECRG